MMPPEAPLKTLQGWGGAAHPSPQTLMRSPERVQEAWRRGAGPGLEAQARSVWNSLPPEAGQPGAGL